MTHCIEQLSLETELKKGVALTPNQPVDIPEISQDEYVNKAELNAGLADELFPTPNEVLAMMLEPYVKENEYYGEFLNTDEIFDPNAGRGHIFEYIEQRFSKHSARIDRSSYSYIACEIEQDLRFILSEKDYTVIGSDWLTFDEHRMFKLIVMNPPFSDGVKHLHHAWRHTAPDGDVVCLLNAQSIQHRYTKEREQLWELIKLYGSHELIGSVFSLSERPTDVEVAIVRLHKPKSATRLEFEDFEYESEEPINYEGFNTSPLAHRDTIKNLVVHYNKARAIVIRRHHTQAQLNFSLSGIERDSYSNENCFELKVSLDKQLKVLKARFWNNVFLKSEIGKQTTSGFIRDFKTFQAKQKAMAFTEANIIEVLEMFFLNRAEILQNCITEVFDKLTQHHENCLIGAWKTNSSYKVNQKIIFPYGISYDKIWGFQLNYGSDCDAYNDLDKVLKYINGDRDIYTITEAIRKHIGKNGYEATGGEYRDPFESSYFTIKIFKKGTVHLKFLDIKLWEEFNRRAAIGKQWIGPDF